MPRRSDKRLDPWCVNRHGGLFGPPCLDLTNEIIWLDWPRRDFEFLELYCGSGGYFCNNGEYGQDVDLSVPWKTEHQYVILDGIELQRCHHINNLPWYKCQPVPRCPDSSPRILNMAHVQVNEKQFQLRLGPNYEDSPQGFYIDIWLGPYKIWTSSSTTSHVPTAHEARKGPRTLHYRKSIPSSANHCEASAERMSPPHW